MSVVWGRDINSPVVYGWAGGTGSGTGGEVGYALAERSLWHSLALEMVLIYDCPALMRLRLYDRS
jgi:hypothetical protein